MIKCLFFSIKLRNQHLNLNFNVSSFSLSWYKIENNENVTS